jgi:hypothetical protein
MTQGWFERKQKDKKKLKERIKQENIFKMIAKLENVNSRI